MPPARPLPPCGEMDSHHFSLNGPFVDVNVCFEIWNINSIRIDNVSLPAGCKTTAGEKGTVTLK